MRPWGTVHRNGIRIGSSGGLRSDPTNCGFPSVPQGGTLPAILVPVQYSALVCVSLETRVVPRRVDLALQTLQRERERRALPAETTSLIAPREEPVRQCREETTHCPSLVPGVRQSLSEAEHRSDVLPLKGEIQSRHPSGSGDGGVVQRRHGGDCPRRDV
ncbi:unnamed protein product [Chondrus crispus]|uniref:Uncharacterized protein n=1 Tax=Chondrus crispus TaxID=2769 RepID=R7Q9X6_CHOCR|nr:unnamed protein product [Chondrus crispus]CDF35332.1 unnamed protein product [Chondrus crispus]|eukprot:XP_005715151.1 unnamed protein product [Chondrus crispus]